jgi:transposase
MTRSVGGDGRSYDHGDSNCITLQEWHCHNPDADRTAPPAAANRGCHGPAARALVGQLDAICRSVDELTKAAEEAFAEHERAAIIASFPGVGALTGARLLAEIGDDPNRFEDARALKAYAGAAPITRASGKANWVGARRAKNDRIAATGYVWALAAVRHDPAWRAHYQRRRAAGERHTAALRNVFNKLIGKLHHCLATGQLYDSDLALPITSAPVAA